MWDWVAQLNAASFAGHADWRLPSEGGHNTPPTGTNELETILDLSVPGCGSGNPCIDAIFGPTSAYAYYRSATTVNSGAPSDMWFVYFGNGAVYSGAKDYFGWVRAVRP